MHLQLTAALIRNSLHICLPKFTPTNRQQAPRGRNHAHLDCVASPNCCQVCDRQGAYKQGGVAQFPIICSYEINTIIPLFLDEKSDAPEVV